MTNQDNISECFNAAARVIAYSTITALVGTPFVVAGLGAAYETGSAGFAAEVAATPLLMGALLTALDYLKPK